MGKQITLNNEDEIQMMQEIFERELDGLLDIIRNEKHYINDKPFLEKAKCDLPVVQRLLKDLQKDQSMNKSKSDLPHFLEWYKGWAIIEVPNAYRMSNGDKTSLYLAIRIHMGAPNSLCEVLADVDLPDLKAGISK
jgi:hypothetical protein